MNILGLLKKDHSEVKKMIRRLQAMDESSPGKRELFEELKAELGAHSHAEEEVLYLRLEETDREKVRMLGFEGGVEHHIVEGLLDSMDKMNVEDECFAASVKVLHELIDDHVKEEETEIFAQTKKLFDRDDLKMMGEEFQRLKERELSGERPTHRERISAFGRPTNFM